MLLPRIKAYTLFIALGALVGLFTLISLPSTVPYSVANRGPSGLYTLRTLLNAEVLYSLDGLESFSSKSTLLISARSKPIGEAQKLLNFVMEGGTALIYGSPENVINLLREMGIYTSFRGYVRDIVFNVEGNLNTVVAYNTRYTRVVFKNPYTLGVDFSEEGIAAWSSVFSHVDINGNGAYDLGEPIGMFPLGLEIAYGSGKIVALFTEQLLENDVLDYNLELITAECENKRALIDQSEVALYPMEALRAYFVHSMPPANAHLVLVLVAILSTVAYYATKR